MQAYYWEDLMKRILYSLATKSAIVVALGFAISVLVQDTYQSCFTRLAKAVCRSLYSPNMLWQAGGT